MVKVDVTLGPVNERTNITRSSASGGSPGAFVGWTPLCDLDLSMCLLFTVSYNCRSLMNVTGGSWKQIKLPEVFVVEVRRRQLEYGLRVNVT